MTIEECTNGQGSIITDLTKSVSNSANISIKSSL